MRSGTCQGWARRRVVSRHEDGQWLIAFCRSKKTRAMPAKKIATALVTIAVMAFASSALGQPAALKTPAELPTWQTITVGLHHSVNAVRDALDEARIAVGESADEILGRPGFTFAEAPTELDLVILSVAELGFGPQGAALADIHERGIRIGLELCPEEVGPQLRLQYLNQPVSESLHVAMKPQRTYRATLPTSRLPISAPDWRCWAAALVPTWCSRRTSSLYSFARNPEVASR
jgi:hypothetical protein